MTLLDRLRIVAEGRLKLRVRPEDATQVAALRLRWDDALRYLGEWDARLDVDRFGHLVVRLPGRLTHGERLDFEREVDPDVQVLLERWLAALPDRAAREAAVAASYDRLQVQRGRRRSSGARWEDHARERAFGASGVSWPGRNGPG